MKSPWKFLVGLTRRHDKHDAPDVISASSEEASSDSDVIAPTVELEAAPPSTNLELSAPASALEEDPEHIEDLPTLAAIAAAAAEGKGNEPVVATSKEAAKRPRRRASNNRAEINSTPVQLATPSDLAQELDSEIHRLRLQLAQKLRVQNAQLRQMLARFEDWVRVGMPESQMEQRVEVQIVNAALKTLCREFGVERDRNSVLEIATLLMRLSKEGIRDAEELAQNARQQLAAVFAAEDASQEGSASI